MTEPDRALMAAEVLRALGVADAGPDGTESVRFFLTVLDASFALGEPGLLADQLRWQTRRLAAVAPDVDPLRMAEVGRDLMASMLSETPDDAAGLLDDTADDLPQHTPAGLLRAHVDAAVAQVRQSPRPLDPAGEERRRLEPVARAYLDHAVAGRHVLAVDAVLEAAESGSTLEQLLLDILEPALVEAGRRWQVDDLTLAEVDSVAALTARTAALVRRRPQPRAANGRRVVGTTVVGAGHDLGLTMVLDLLHRAGWTTSRLAPADSEAALVEQLAVEAADVLAVSVTVAADVLAAQRLVRAVRDDPRTAGVAVVLGGRPVRESARLADVVGADDVAPDGRSAVRVCERLVQRRATPGGAGDGDLRAELRALTHRLVSLQRESAQAQARLTAQSAQARTLLGMVAHDLAGPLQSMIGLAALIGDDSDLTHRQRDLAARIVRAGRDALDLVDDLGHGLLLDLGAERQRQHLDLVDLLESLVVRVRRAVGEATAVVLHPVPRGRAVVQGDPVGLERLVERMVRHVIAGVGSGGEVAASFAVDHAEVVLRVRASRTAPSRARRAGLTGLDGLDGLDGPDGLDEPNAHPAGPLDGTAQTAPLVPLDELFDTYETEAADGLGSALGLAVCRRIAEQHGGTLSVESHFSVSLTLPVRPTEEHGPGQGPRPGPALSLVHGGTGSTRSPGAPGGPSRTDPTPD